jgi:hypothetical protein
MSESTRDLAWVRRFAAFSLVIVSIAGCERTGGVQASAVLRDSAGVTIVENPRLDAVPGHRVSAPTLTIGGASGPEEHELHDVTAVVRLSDGGVAVATGGTEIRWFGADGAFRRRAGREGAGPGEFRRLRYMRALPGDSLLAYDSDNRRVSIIAPDGAYVRGESIALTDDRPLTVAGALLDGTLLTRTMVQTPGTSIPLYRVRMEFAVSRGGATVPVRTYLGPEASLHADGSGGGIGSVFISVLPFARSVHAAAGPQRFFVGSSDSYEIDVWDPLGRLVRIIRADVPVTAVTEDVRQTYIDGEMERRRREADDRGQPFDGPSALRQLREQAHAPALPAYASLLATAEGGLWVKSFTMAGPEPAGERWAIFDAEGRLSAVVELPPGFTPMFVEGPVVLGVWRDRLDVPYVHAYTVSTG